MLSRDLRWLIALRTMLALRSTSLRTFPICGFSLATGFSAEIRGLGLRAEASMERLHWSVVKRSYGGKGASKDFVVAAHA